MTAAAIAAGKISTAARAIIDLPEGGHLGICCDDLSFSLQTAKLFENT